MQVDRLLSLDLEDTDLQYRFQKGDSFVYVTIRPPSLIPQEDRIEGSRILSHLQALPIWKESWHTLEISGSPECPHFERDPREPHRIAPSLLAADVKRYNLGHIQVLDRISNRLFKGHVDGRKVVVKIARFEHELRYLQQEFLAYHFLRACSSIPAFYGYVFEEKEERIIGFVMEELIGRHASPEDLEECLAVIRTLHSIDFCHGDVNRYNLIQTEEGMKIFDLEASCFPAEASLLEAEEIMLEANLTDPSTRGLR